MTDKILTSADVAAVGSVGFYPQNAGSFVVDVPTHGAKPGGSFNWFGHIFSTFTMLCCCWCACFSSVMGLTGLLFSISAYTDRKSGDYDRYTYKRNCALAWSLAGMILGLAALGGVAYAGYKYGPSLYSQATAYVNNTIADLLAPFIPALPTSSGG